MHLCSIMWTRTHDLLWPVNWEWQSLSIIGFKNQCRVCHSLFHSATWLAAFQREAALLAGFCCKHKVNQSHSWQGTWARNQALLLWVPEIWRPFVTAIQPNSSWRMLIAYQKQQKEPKFRSWFCHKIVMWTWTFLFFFFFQFSHFYWGPSGRECPSGQWRCSQFHNQPEFLGYEYFMFCPTAFTFERTL